MRVFSLHFGNVFKTDGVAIWVVVNDLFRHIEFCVHRRANMDWHGGVLVLQLTTWKRVAMSRQRVVERDRVHAIFRHLVAVHIDADLFVLFSIHHHVGEVGNPTE